MAVSYCKTQGAKKNRYRTLYGVAVLQGVQVQSLAEVCRCKLGPDVIVREEIVNAQILDPWGKPLIQPQMGPPFLKQNNTI